MYSSCCTCVSLDAAIVGLNIETVLCSSIVEAIVPYIRSSDVAMVHFATKELQAALVPSG